MKKTLTLTFMALLFFVLLITPKAFAHELFIDIKEDRVTGELQIDVLWGHIRDFLDNANHENYELFVKDPEGNVSQLELEKIGVQARAFLTPQVDGEYVFWANRAPGTYTPGDDITRLSVQMAKTVYQVGTGNEIASEPTGLLLEIVPETSLSNFHTGNVNGIVLYEGNPLADAVVTAYGPKDEILEGTTDADGAFDFNLTSTGKWLIKANFETDESGTLNEDEYERTSRTTTLLIDTSQENSPTSSSDNNSSPITYIALIVIGLLVGAAITFMFVRK